MMGILIIVILILVVSFIMAFIVSSKDFSRISNLADDPKILFEDRNEYSVVSNPVIADEIKIDLNHNIEKNETTEEVEELFDDELI